MVTGAEEFVPETRRLATLADAAKRCQGCDLFREATQVVFGAGPPSTRMVLVGEQPGDRVVLLGATAAKSLMGNDFRLTAHRGEVLELPDDSGRARLRARPLVVATAHPSAVLRGPADGREAAFADLVSDLRCAAQVLDSQTTGV